MTETRDYQPTAIEQRLRRWVRRATNEAVPVVYANQGKPRRARPFIMLQVLTDTEGQTATEHVTDTPHPSGDGYTVEIVEVREGTVQVSCVGSQSWALARQVARSIGAYRVIDANSADGLEVREAITPILDRPLQLTTTVEPRRVQDFAFAYIEVTEDVEGAEVVERTIGVGDIYQSEPGDGVDETVDVSWP